jgi:hypothetical protein
MGVSRCKVVSYRRRRSVALLRSALEFGHLEPRSGKRILAWRVNARLIVTECSSPERAADILSLSVALSGLTAFDPCIPRAYALG